MKLPRTFIKLSQDQQGFLNFRYRTHAYDRIRIFQRMTDIKKIFSKDLFKHENVFDGKIDMGYMTEQQWDSVITQYSNRKVKFDGIEYKVGKLDEHLKSQIKPIFYDWLIALKTPNGHLSSLLAVEYLGCADEGYLMKKDWDAGQYKSDRMPMLYVVVTPKIKHEYLKKAQIIGRDFPILTQTEFDYFVKGLHAAYKQMGNEFSLRNYLKSMMEITTISGKTQKNYEHWGIPGQYAMMIQGSFGVAPNGLLYNEEKGGHAAFSWFRKGYKYGGKPYGPWYVQYAWRESLEKGFWAFSDGSLIENENQDMGKIFLQFEIWLKQLNNLAPQSYNNGEYYTIPYGS
ncbi:MAG: hypothetical protein DRO88_13680 [Promethearchaeia archaeon]|nr:MAG: hypothetical protein DRO88_13680 [Candidatus Lokiarchaeia archaeon]